MTVAVVIKLAKAGVSHDIGGASHRLPKSL